MADLAKSAVEIVRSWYGTSQAKQIINRRLRLTLTGQGGTTNTIPASVLGFSKIESCTPLTEDDDSVVVVANPSYDGLTLLLKAAGTNAPADYTGTFECVVSGR